MIRERLGKDLLFFDGGMGTLLQEEGLLPENCRKAGILHIRRSFRVYTGSI